jgi:hypothetical protein
MSWGFRKHIGLGRLLGINISRRGVSLSGRLGPFSSNTRTRRLRVRLPFNSWWQSRKWGS